MRQANGSSTSPILASSRMVTKVAGGHNCWLASDSACADVITAYITAWAGGAAVPAMSFNSSPRHCGIRAQARVSLPIPDLFATTVHPLLTAHCAACHVDSATNAQSPFFADSDPDKSYEAAQAEDGSG